MENIFTPYPTTQQSPSSPSPTSFTTPLTSLCSISDNTLLMGMINKLEGYKTKMKELHFCAKQFHTERGNLHVLLDDVTSLVSAYQDILGEVGQSFLGHMRFNSLSGILPSVNYPVEIIELLVNNTIEFRKNIPNDVIWNGIINATDDFIQNIQQKLYLGQLYVGNKVITV